MDCTSGYANAPCPPPPPHGLLPYTGSPLELVLLLGIVVGIAVAVFALVGLAIWSERAR